MIRLTPLRRRPRPRNLVPARAWPVGSRRSAQRSLRFVGRRGVRRRKRCFRRVLDRPREPHRAQADHLSFEERRPCRGQPRRCRDSATRGGLQPGQKVLINGAGWLGTWAVQIARRSAPRSPRCQHPQVDMVRALGADEVITTQGGLRPGGARFDLMLDTVGNRSLPIAGASCATGTFVSCSGAGRDEGGSSGWRGPAGVDL